MGRILKQATESSVKDAKRVANYRVFYESDDELLSQSLPQQLRERRIGSRWLLDGHIQRRLGTHAGPDAAGSCLAAVGDVLGDSIISYGYSGLLHATILTCCMLLWCPEVAGTLRPAKYSVRVPIGTDGSRYIDTILYLRWQALNKRERTLGMATGEPPLAAAVALACW